MAPGSSAAAVAPAETPSISQLSELQTHLRTSLTDSFSRGYAIVGVRFTTSGVDYCLAPYSDF